MVSLGRRPRNLKTQRKQALIARLNATIGSNLVRRVNRAFSACAFGVA